MDLSQIQLSNVDLSSKLWIHRPDVTTINPARCVDMDCDGLKKVILTDLDGSYFGQQGTGFSQSEWQWGGDPARGLGDYRIPQVALADANGHLKNISQVYKYRGIVREEDKCTFMNDWQGWHCNDMTMKILVIESMDTDTEKRRLSPVAIVSDGNMYLDLINGPEDHGWCFGYSCMTRISTFFAVVAPNKNYDIYLTSTPPNQLRFRILNADSSFKIRLSMYYFLSSRIDIYLNGVFKAPTNAYYINNNMILSNPANNLTYFMPNYTSSSGTNLFYNKQMFWSMTGADLIDVEIAPVLYIQFGLPAITPDSFFNSDTLVANFAALLGLSPSQIRNVDIVSASSVNRRVKRGASSTVSLTIFQNAAQLQNDTDAKNMATTQLQAASSSIANQFATGQLQSSAESLLNVSFTNMNIKHPMSNPNKSSASIGVVDGIQILRQASLCSAQVPCQIQPIIQLIDINVSISKFYLKI